MILCIKKFIHRYTSRRFPISTTKTVNCPSTILQITRISPTRYRQYSPILGPFKFLPKDRGSAKTATRSYSQASGINADTLDKLFLATDDSIRGIQDRALLLLAYDTL
jgi:hypothetical protein